MTIQKELIPMRPGDILRFERGQKGLTLEQASRQSRIRLSVIDAIETGETGAIPSVYLRGYIRNYARFLGVDPAELESQMEHVHGAEPEVRTVFTVETKRGNSEKWLKVSSYLVASALMATLAWQFTHEAVRFSQGDSQLTSATAAPEEPMETGKEEPATAARSSNTHLSASIAPVEMLKQDSGLSGNSAAEQAWAAIGGQSETLAASAFQPQTLTVTASADTWIEITDVNGEQLELDLVRAGSNREYRGLAPFQVMIGRASAVVLTMDGQAIDLGPHTRGNVARMTLNDQ